MAVLLWRPASAGTAIDSTDDRDESIPSAVSFEGIGAGVSNEKKLKSKETQVGTKHKEVEN